MGLFSIGVSIIRIGLRCPFYYNHNKHLLKEPLKEPLNEALNEPLKGPLKGALKGTPYIDLLKEPLKEPLKDALDEPLNSLEVNFRARRHEPLP